MNVVVVTPVRLFGDGLGACLGSRPGVTVEAVVSDLARLRDVLAQTPVDVVMVDVTHAVNPFDVRSIAVQYPAVKLVALGLVEQQQDVVRAGRSGFAGYVSRDSSLDALCQSLVDIAAGRMAIPPEIAGGLLQALFRPEANADGDLPHVALTRREGEVLALLGEGLSNKEIGNELCLSVATVKHHVHHVLEKLQLPGRAQAMRKVRDVPWLAAGPPLSRSRQG